MPNLDNPWILRGFRLVYYVTTVRCNGLRQADAASGVILENLSRTTIIRRVVRVVGTISNPALSAGIPFFFRLLHDAA